MHPCGWTHWGGVANFVRYKYYSTIILPNFGKNYTMLKLRKLQDVAEENQKTLTSLPRLLKLYIKTKDNCKMILQNAKNLRNSEDAHIKQCIYQP